MNAIEAGDLLAMLAMLDNRQVDEDMARAWAWALADVPAPRAAAAVEQLVHAGEAWIDAKAIRRQLAIMRPTFERDIRSAKARGLVAADWPADRPLDVDVEQQLRAAQAAEWAHGNDEPTAVTASGAALGITIRTVPA